MIATTPAPLGKKGIADAIVSAGYATRTQVDLAQRKVRAFAELGKHYDLCDVLVRDRFISREQASTILSAANTTGGSTAAHQSILPFDVCQRYSVLPVQVTNDELTVRAAGRLLPKQISNVLASCTKPVKRLRIEPISRQQLLQQLASSIRDESSFASLIEQIKSEELTGILLRRTIDALLSEALDARTSDIHLDCKPDPESWVSFRVDNVLQQRHLIPERIMAAIFTRIKTEAGMDASDTVRSQDGRFSFDHRGKMVDFRVASQPIAGGETLTLRSLDAEALPSLDLLFQGQQDMVDIFKSLTRIQGKNGGLILFSGPTGSGKTTTLYTLTQRFPRDSINVITVEDPVEYQLPFARQIQINQVLNQKAVDVETSILRQDPDVIVFGEIRNADSARAALKFTESGHLVLATIHAVSAPQTFERFMSFFDGEGKKEAMFVMAHFLRLIVNQRLVRRLCKCATPISSSTNVRRATGCKSCNNTGYRGRVVAHETIMLPGADDVRAPIADSLVTHGRVEDVLGMKGVMHKRRQHTMSDLLAVGVVDLRTTSQLLEI